MRSLFIQIVASLMGTFAATAAALAAPPENGLPVCGEPGGGHIRVETAGGKEHWGHPGIYWLPKDTNLLDFTKLAAPVDLPGGEAPGSVWIRIMHGGKFRGHFQLRRIQAGKVASDFVLEDGDVLQTVPAL